MNNPQTTRYRHRPDECDAVQWTDTNAAELEAFAGSRFMTIDPEDRTDDPDATAAIRSSKHESWALLLPGDWVIRRGDSFTLLPDDEFTDLYEPVAAPVPADRAAIAAHLWQIAEHHTVAEWICCDPIDPAHDLCVQGGVALQMLKALLVDDLEAWKPAPLLDAVMALVTPPVVRPELRDQIAEALRESCMTEDEAVGPMTEAVLAVLPQPVDRAAVLREAATIVRSMDSDYALQEAAEHLDGLAVEEDEEREAQAHLDQLADELAAAIASCPGRELSPNPCRCPCYGCKHHCGAHDPSGVAVEAQQQTETPCGPTPDQCDPETGEPCDVHETERAHAEGDHEHCGVTCEAQYPSEQMRNFVVAKGYPGTAGMLDELLRRAAVSQPGKEN